jgi:hypothetical protein
MSEETSVALEKIPINPASQTLVSRVESFELIETQAEAEEAAALRKEIGEARKGIWDDATKFVDAARKPWQMLTERRKQAIKPYEDLERKLIGFLDGYREREAERVRQERIEDAKRKQAEAAAEKKRLAEELRSTGMTKREATAVAREQVKAEVENAQAVAAAEPEPVKVKGARVVKPWTGTVVSLKALCAEIAAGVAPVSLVKVDQAALNRYAASVKNTKPVKGVIFQNDARTTR